MLIEARQQLALRAAAVVPAVAGGGRVDRARLGARRGWCSLPAWSCRRHFTYGYRRSRSRRRRSSRSSCAPGPGARRWPAPAGVCSCSSWALSGRCRCGTRSPAVATSAACSAQGGGGAARSGVEGRADHGRVGVPAAVRSRPGRWATCCAAAAGPPWSCRCRTCGVGALLGGAGALGLGVARGDGRDRAGGAGFGGDGGGADPADRAVRHRGAELLLVVAGGRVRGADLVGAALRAPVRPAGDARAVRRGRGGVLAGVVVLGSSLCCDRRTSCPRRGPSGRSAASSPGR